MKMKNKICSWLQLCMVTAMMVLLISTTALADTHNENDGGDANLNGTMETAETIKRNISSLEGYVNGTANQTNYVVWGTLDKNFDDEDWFKVPLLANRENFLNTKVTSGVRATFTVYDSNGNYIADFDEGVTTGLIPGGVVPHRLNIPEDGIYYIQVTRSIGMPAHETTYTFAAGDAMVDMGNIKVTPTPVLTLSATQATDSATYDFRNLAVPSNAMVRTIALSIKKSGSSASSLSYAIQGPVDRKVFPVGNRIEYGSYTSPLRDFWTLEATGTVRTGEATLTPTLTMYYVYYVTPESLQ